MSGLLAAVGRRIPQSLVQALGRRMGQGSLLAPLDRLARRALAGDGTIAHGTGAGLRFNAAGGRAGFSLGTWEPETQDVLAELLGPGDVFFDIGAATGFYAVIGARCVGPTGRVVAFEPFAENLAALRHNIRLNAFENVEVVEAAVSNMDGRAIMVPEATDEVSLVMKVIDPDEAGVDSVLVTSLDALLDANRIPVPTLVKMDVEGAEVEVLKGARRLLETHGPTLLIEVHERWHELAPILAAARYDYLPIEGIDPSDADRAVHIVATPMKAV